MNTKQPLMLNVEQCVDHIIEVFGQDVRIGMPLGLGKPIALINALYRRAKRNPELSLTIFTALSLEKPRWSSELERRFLEPFVERVWAGVPDLDFLTDLRRGEMPPNVKLHELFFKAGAYKGLDTMQQNHICSNYTHVVRDCAINGNAIFAHMIARNSVDGETRYSASCNADTAVQTLQMFERDQARGEKRLRIGMVNDQLPFMYGDAELDAHMYDIIVDCPQGHHPLFSTPHVPLSDSDYMIGLNASALIKDGGTLQIGIGSLGDAIAYGLNLRHNHNESYQALLKSSGVLAQNRQLIDEVGGTQPLPQGLYGSTEMLVDGFLQLYKAGVVKREVFHHAGLQSLINQGRLERAIPANLLDMLVDDELIHPYLTKPEFERLQHFGVFAQDVTYDNGYLVRGGQRYSALLVDKAHRDQLAQACLGSELKHGVILTGGFFIGPSDFYDTLRAMPDSERRRFEMAGVEVANQLYGDEKLRSLQRKDARLCNTGMKATLLGHIISDGLEDGSVVSGVGGQYNFVAMAHALPDARLIMMVKSTRHEGANTLSNIVINYGHVTIPRHLRDIVVTEYGIADIRGKSDQEIVKAMLNIADSRFQPELLAQAKQQRKVPQDYEIPQQFRNNTPHRLADVLHGYKAQGMFAAFPFGTAFTNEELMIAHALKVLKAKSIGNAKEELAAAMQGLPATPPEHAMPYLKRMDLAKPNGREDAALQKTMLLALRLATII